MILSKFKKVPFIFLRSIEKRIAYNYATEAKASLDSAEFNAATAVKEKMSGVKVNVDTDIDTMRGIEKSIKFALTEKKELLPSAPATFDDMPGPLVLSKIADFWKVIPVVGTQLAANTIQYMLGAGKLLGSQLSWGPNAWVFKYLLDEYGPIVRLQGPFGGNVVIISRPEHIADISNNEGPYPLRSSLDSLEKYRLKHRNFKQSGPFLMSGPEWEVIRKSIDGPLNFSSNQQLQKFDKISDDLIFRILTLRNRQDEVPASFEDEVLKWSTECLCSAIFNRRFNFLDPCGLSVTSDAGRLFSGIKGATDGIRRCEFGLHLWKFIETPAYRNLVKNCDAMDTVLKKFIQRTQENLKMAPKTAQADASLLEVILLKDNITTEDCLTILMDMLLIGVNTTTHTMSFLMYHLSRFPRAQTRLYNEIKNIKTFDRQTIQKLPFLKACLQESLRLAPPMPIISRIMGHDVTVHNYRIPQGTHVLMATYLSSLREEHFEDALKFKPERWLDKDMCENLPALASIPFGVGSRACVAKEFSELQVSVLLIKVLQKFRIDYYYGDIKSTNTLLAKANRPLKFRFVERN